MSDFYLNLPFPLPVRESTFDTGRNISIKIYYSSTYENFSWGLSGDIGTGGEWRNPRREDSVSEFSPLVLLPMKKY